MDTRPVSTHRFSEDIISRVRQCAQIDNWHGPLELLGDWLVIAAAITVSCLSFRHLNFLLGVVIYAVAIFLIGGRQRALADILHQASHHTLMSNRKLGKMLGTLFAGYLVLQSYSGYWHTHVYFHHRSLGDPVMDPDYVQYQRNNLCRENLRRSVLIRYLRSLCGLRANVSYVRYLFRDRMWNLHESRGERWFRIFYYILICVIATYYHLWMYLGLYWFLPLVTTQAWIGALLELTEHYPMIETAPRVDIYLSRNRECGWIGNFLLGVQQQEGYHLVHHRFPYVPRWRYHEVHLLLMEDREYASLHEGKGWPALVRSMLAAVPE